MFTLCRIEMKSVSATLPTITPQEVTRPTTSGGEWTMYKVGDELWFQCGYLWATGACRLWKTTDLDGNTTPSWTEVANAPTNITFWANSYLTKDGNWLYGQVTNWTKSSSGYYGMRMNVSDGSVSNLTHNIIAIGWVNVKMHAWDEVGNTIYYANYRDTTPPPDGSGVIANLTLGNYSITKFYNMTNECNALHVHSVDYSETTQRLYFSLDDGAGYINMTNEQLTWIRDGGFSKASMCEEVFVYDENEIFTGSDHTTETFVDRYDLNGNPLNKYDLEHATETLFKRIFVHGDKLLIAGNPTGLTSINHGWTLLNLVDGSYKWIVNSTDTNDVIVNAERFGNYIYYMWGGKLYVMNLTNVPLYDYVAENNNIQLRYVGGANAMVTSFNYENNKLALTINGNSGQTSTTKVYCGDKGEPTAVYARNGTLTWSYNASTTILTLNIVHSGPANILVDWRIPGDVNGDGDVDGSDLFDLGKAYGSKLGDPNWNLDCDFNWDSKVDASDLFDLSKNYERTKT